MWIQECTTNRFWDFGRIYNRYVYNTEQSDSQYCTSILNQECFLTKDTTQRGYINSNK